MALLRFPCRPGERVALVSIAGLAALVLVGVGRGAAPIDWRSYGSTLTPVLVFGLIGAFYRLTRRSELIAAPMLATGLLFLFASALATFNYTLLPVSRPLIDPWLFETNGYFGYRWSEWVAWGAAHPSLSRLLAAVYASSLPQIMALVLALGFTRRFAELDRMVATLVIGALGTVFFWALFPSISVSAFESVPAELERLARPAVNMAEGAKLLSLVTLGPDRISPDTMTGVIGFPSFHTVLACLCTRAAWEMRPARWVVLPLNLLMVPAILLHGSHHVLDVFGGVLFFLAARRLAVLATSGSAVQASGRQPAPLTAR